MIQEMKLLFEFGPFYDLKHEDQIPSLEETKSHFNAFIIEYRYIGAKVDEMYKQSNANTMLFFSGQAIDKPADRENYWLWHAYSNKLKRYYQYLLTACSNKYNFWLNDLLPKEPARKKRRTLKSATHQEAKYITEIK